MPFIKKKYSIRHKILKVLQDKLTPLDSKQQLSQSEIELSLKQLCNKTKLNEQQILGQTDYLASKEEINCEWDNREQKFFILKEGTISYFDKKYLDEGRKEFWNNTYDIIKTVSAVIILVIAVFTFVLNVIDTRKNKSDIQKLQEQVGKLNEQTSNSLPAKH